MADPKQASKRRRQPVKVEPLEVVLNKYIDAGWKTMMGRGMYDIIAEHAHRLHFICVVNHATLSDPKYSGLSKNQFIQNAFSNGAVPVYAYVHTDGMVTITDINLDTRLVIGRKQKKTNPTG